jgi:PAS domain S-box-containing protein
MNTQPPSPLREEAQKLLQEREGASLPAPGPAERAAAAAPMNRTDGADVAAVLHDLQVHQIELELQNEELREAKIALEISRARYFDLYDLAPVGYCSLDGKGRIAQCNLMLASLLGVVRGAVLGRYFSYFVSRQDVDNFYRACGKSSPVALGFDLELQMRKADGSTLWVAVKAVEDQPLGSDWDPLRPGLRLAVTDISLRKQAEATLLDQQQQLRESNQLLEQRVQERTQELEQARRVAEAAMQSRGEFLAKMSHEIRTPLNAITGMARLVRKEPLSVLQSERLAKLEFAGTHLLGIVNDILDLSKIDADKLVLEAAPLHMESIVANVLAMADARAQDKQIELLCDVAALPPNLVGDATRLQQALLNYVSNAIKFTEAGGVTLRVLLQQESDTEAVLLFEVQDTGIGIAPQTLGRLFAPFEQADNTTSRRYGGTGLGLAITRKLAQRMGGEAGARSVPDVGSTFWFSARFDKGAALAPSALDAPDAHALDTLRAHYPGLRVLVAEDEPVNCEIATMLLEDAGCVVYSAEDDAQALEMAARQAYGLILMDMQMPGMDGLEATRQIRLLAGYARTPVIAMTANAFAEDRLRCLDAGMDDFLTKPVVPLQLYSCMLRSLATMRLD